MIPFARLLLLLTWRQVGGRALLLGALVFPLLLGLFLRRISAESGNTTLEDAELTAIFGSLAFVMQLANSGGSAHRLVSALANERLTGRSRLIAAAGLGPASAARALALFGTVLTALLAIEASFAFFVTTAGTAIPAMAWLRLGLLGACLGALVACVATLAALALPKVPALIVAHAVNVLLAAHAIQTGPWLAGVSGTRAFEPPCTLALVAPLLLLVVIAWERRLLVRAWP